MQKSRKTKVVKKVPESEKENEDPLISSDDDSNQPIAYPLEESEAHDNTPCSLENLPKSLEEI